MRTNLRHGTILGALLWALALWGLRTCSWPYFFVFGLLPLFSYALLGSRTFAFGPLSGAVVVVTGASSGIGRAIAIAAAEQGAVKIFLVARSREGLDVTAAAIAALPVPVTLYFP